MNPGSFYFMGISQYSFVMALLFCSGMILVSAILVHRPGFIKNFGGRYLLMMMLAGVLRLVFSFEFPYSITIHSYQIWPHMQRVFRAELFSAFGRSFNLTYTLGIDNQAYGVVSEELLDDSPYIDLPIQTGE